MLRLAHTQNYIAVSPSKEQARGGGWATLPAWGQQQGWLGPVLLCSLTFKTLNIDTHSRTLHPGQHSHPKSCSQVARQPAMECIPLVMEPRSRLYTAPVAVLDFQSLYPSMIIAYNLCFSTCLGRPSHARAGSAGGGPAPRLGCMEYALPEGGCGSWHYPAPHDTRISMDRMCWKHSNVQPARGLSSHGAYLASVLCGVLPSLVQACCWLRVWTPPR